MDMNLYIIVGTTGEYSDQHTWLVAAMASEMEAADACSAMNAWLKERSLHESNRGDLEDWDRFQECPFDPGLCVDYTGTSYSVCKVPLRVGLSWIGGEASK